MHNRILVPIKLKHTAFSSELVAKAVSMARAENAEIITLTVVPEINDNLKVLPEDSQPELEAFVKAMIGGRLGTGRWCAPASPTAPSCAWRASSAAT